MVAKTQKENDKESIKESKPVTIVLIHAEWCGHCKNLMPHWKKIEDEYDNHPEIEMVKIESKDDDKDVVINDLNGRIVGEKKVEEEGYPTIYAIKGGALIKNENDRDYDSLKNWVGGLLSTSQTGGKRRNKKTRNQQHRRNRKTKQHRKLRKKN